MKILVFSDSHNNAFRIEQALLSHRDAELIIHLGDGTTDLLSVQAAYPQYRYEYVLGNCDYTKENVPEEKLIEVENKKIFMVHGHLYKSPKLICRAAQVGADIVLYGHTHRPKVSTHEGILFINPGCVSMAKVKNTKSYLILEIENGEVNYRFIPII